MNDYPNIPSVYLNPNFKYYRNDPESQMEAVMDGLSGWDLFHNNELPYNLLRPGLIKIGKCLDVIPTYQLLVRMSFGYDAHIPGTYDPLDADKTGILINENHRDPY